MRKIITLFMIMASSSAFSQTSGTLAKLKQVLSNDNNGVKTDAVIIYKDGSKIFELYAREYHPSKKHLSWSIAKTISGILIGQAVSDKMITYDSKIKQFLPRIKTNATIGDLLAMSSGIRFKEEYSGIPVDSDATKMLYLQGPKLGFSYYVSSLPARTEALAGNHFYYSSGDTNLLMEILKKVSKSVEEYNHYPWKKLFTPLGIKNATFEQDASGTFVGSSYIYLSANDFLKIGQLLMQDGVWEGTQVIPKDYLLKMKQVARGVKVSALKGTSQTRSYSSQITTNLPIIERGLPSEYMDLPQDALLMFGFQGQMVVASPSQKLVIVRLAMDSGDSFDLKLFLNLTSKLIREKKYKLITAGDEGTARAVSPPVSSTPETRVNILDYLNVPDLIRAFAAKEYCSCMLVVGRSEKACKDDLKISLPLLPRLMISEDKKTVSADFLLGVFNVSQAEYRGEMLGCTLIDSK